MNYPLSLVLAIVFGGILTAFFLALCSRRGMGILQQENYSGKALVKWAFRKGNLEGRRYSLLALSLALLTALFSLCFCFAGYKIANLVALVPYAGVYALYVISEEKHALKVPLKATPRIVRLSVCNAVLLAAFACGFGFACEAVAQAVNSEWYHIFRYVPFALLPFAIPFVLALSNLIMKAYEVPHANKFVKAAAKTLQASACVKVGITGSYGKTSVKHYAAQILSAKYRVLATPASFNTPLGIARAVNENGLDCDIFLAEMGARRTGDIAELCDLVQPAVGVVTGVCGQHLETFGSIENIRAEKGVLAARAKEAVLGSTAVGLREDAFAEGRDFGAENVALGADGVSFVLKLGGNRIPVSLPLYGRQAAENVALAAALCLKLGMTAEEIAAEIPKLRPVPHRLEKSEGNGLFILDDSYNSNPEGAKNAVEALKAFGGKKCVVTPGLVELGAIEAQTNEELGGLLVGLDLVILVGETRVLPVRNGYLAAGGKPENLRIVPALEAAQEIYARELAAGDCILFLNDLPDKYAR
ncbi:MAG: hypothetical protein K2H43_00495 [Clostridia bacterium]|nr:hypothetical protein [Clostridia bacterium]